MSSLRHLKADPLALVIASVVLTLCKSVSLVVADSLSCSFFGHKEQGEELKAACSGL